MNPTPSQRVVLQATLDQLFNECQLITEKKSKLSKAQRDMCMARFQFHLSKGHYKLEDPHPETEQRAWSVEVRP